MNKDEKIIKIFETEKNGIQNILNNLEVKNLSTFFKLCNEAKKAIKNKKKLIFFGNGGSASDAQHLATELTVRYKRNRKAISAISLATDTSALTAIGNDFGFNYIFSRQLEAIGKRGDISIAITTSGNSQNLIESCKMAKKKGIIFYVFSGNKGGKLKKFTKNLIIVPSKVTSQIQVTEIFLGQILCDYLETFASK
jgi:D-sedoheptulose 7-phosphate isomerase